jgi:hypothetical protein
MPDVAERHGDELEALVVAADEVVRRQPLAGDVVDTPVRLGGVEHAQRLARRQPLQVGYADLDHERRPASARSDTSRNGRKEKP